MTVMNIKNEMMKKIFFLPFILVVLLAMLSCEKEIKITGTASPLVSLNDVRALYKGNPIVLSADDMMGASYISGVVISDPVNGNAPEGLVVLQSMRRKLLRGIALEMGPDALGYNPGDSLVIQIAGKTLDRIDGVLQIADVSVDDVTRVSVGNTQHINITSTTFTDVTQWMDMYESTLVNLRSVITPDLEFGDVFSGSVKLSDWVNTLKLITLPTATFASDGVPGFGDYIGIMLNNAATEPILMLRSADDYESQSLEPYHPGDLYMNFPESFETMEGTHATGYTNKYETFPSGEWYLTNGYRFNSGNIKNKEGTWTIMSRGGVTMNFNLPYGASKLSFVYGTATDGDPVPMAIIVEYSQDSGSTWQLVDPDEPELPIINAAKQTYSKELDIVGPVRFRILREPRGGTATTARVSIDHIGVHQN